MYWPPNVAAAAAAAAAAVPFDDLSSDTEDSSEDSEEDSEDLGTDSSDSAVREAYTAADSDDSEDSDSQPASQGMATDSTMSAPDVPLGYVFMHCKCLAVCCSDVLMSDVLIHRGDQAAAAAGSSTLADLEPEPYGTLHRAVTKATFEATRARRDRARARAVNPIVDLAVTTDEDDAY